jgi:hypothetical protein
MADRAEKQKTSNENNSVSFLRRRFLTPSDAAKSIQQRLEQSSGKPVVVDRSNELMGYATIRIASSDSPAHLFRYKPEFESELPYLLAIQRIAPGTDVGIDFSREYEAAKELGPG